MTINIPQNDPASSLWQQCNVEELAIIWDLFNYRPVPVGKIALRLGLQVVSKTLPTNISGSIRIQDGVYRVEINNTDAPVRQRFTVCHEIGHYLLHRHLIDESGIIDSILYRSELSNAKEAEANRIAAAILLPWEQVNNWHAGEFGTPPSVENVEHIASEFKASRLAVGYRFGF